MDLNRANPLPCAFLFVVPRGGDDEGESLDEAFLNALRAADPQGRAEMRVYRGGILLARLAYKPSAIKVEPALRRKSGKSVSSQTSTTERADMGLYATLIGDFVETCLAQWNTVDSNSFWEYVANRALDATIVSSLSLEVMRDMDEYLRSHPLYIGAVSPDLSNPLHRYLFVDVMFKDAFIRGGRVFGRAGFDGEYEGSFFGADTFSRDGMGIVPYEDFDETAPHVDFPESLSARGLITEMRMQKRLAQDIYEKILGDLRHSDSLRNFDSPFEWDLAQLPDSPEEVEVQARKLTDYLLDPEHQDGGSKSKFFGDVLAIRREDWTYLQGQLIDGLGNVLYKDVRLDEHGIRFTAYLPVTGRNGETATIETGWIVRPGERANFVTAYPAKKNPVLEGQTSPPPIVSDNLEGDARWQAIFDLADESGKRAMEECVPKPLVVDNQVYMDGDCGGAFIVIKDGRTSFARWLRKNGRGSRHYPSGYSISARQLGQSAETAKAYAEAFARILRRNHIECRSEIYLT